MAQTDAERSLIGRTALGGAAGGFTYDGALQDAVARERRLRRTLRVPRWQDETARIPPVTGPRSEQAEPAGAEPPR